MGPLRIGYEVGEATHATDIRPSPRFSLSLSHLFHLFDSDFGDICAEYVATYIPVANNSNFFVDTNFNN